MQLTVPDCLSASTITSQDIQDVARISNSTRLTSPIARLRYGKTSEQDAFQWFLSLSSAALPADLNIPRISSLFTVQQTSHLIPAEIAAEHLAIRDLDLPQQPPSVDSTGTIISSASYFFYPNGPPPRMPSISSPAGSSISPLPGYHADFSNYWNSRIESTLHSTFAPLPCFNLHSIATLTPSHLRKGTAKQLVEWIFPYADCVGLPVVLAASAMGVKLYEKCGFVEVGVVEVDMGLWGWDGDEDERMHVHRIMIRWPKAEAGLNASWKEWKIEKGL